MNRSYVTNVQIIKHRIVPYLFTEQIYWTVL